MINIFLVLFGKFIIFLSRFLNLGHGSTWPGHIALILNKYFIADVLNKSQIKIIVIAGTNGKTTTGKLIQTILEKNGRKVFQNTAGANLLNGIASSLIINSSFLGSIETDYAIFEVDENTLPLLLTEIKPNAVILLNLFRDQLDRYGEVDTIAHKWEKALNNLTKNSTLILNADDPQIAFLGKNTKAKTLYFGLDDKKLSTINKQNAADTTYCPKCNAKLIFETIYFSHLGNWKCSQCSEKRPKLNPVEITHYPLPGIYNRYNTKAAILFAQNINVNRKNIKRALKDFKPAFGRQEILSVKDKKVQIFLSKNPTSFNESLRTVSELKGKTLLFVLNDRIPDGRDVSWIWDVNMEEFIDGINIIVSGDRCLDIALRLKYAGSSKFQIEENLKKAIKLSLNKISKSEILYIMPTYSAMLEVRKVLTGKKIL